MNKQVKALILAVIILGFFISGCQSKKNSGSSNVKPYVVFLTQNALKNITDNNHDTNIASIKIIEGDVKIRDINIMISADAATFYKYNDCTPVPNDKKPEEWNPNESVIINKTKVPSEILDKNGNWPTKEFHVIIKFIPTNQRMFADSILLE